MNDDLASRVERGEAGNEEIARALGFEHRPGWAKDGVWARGDQVFSARTLPPYLTDIREVIAECDWLFPGCSRMLCKHGGSDPQYYTAWVGPHPIATSASEVGALAAALIRAIDAGRAQGGGQ